MPNKKFNIIRLILIGIFGITAIFYLIKSASWDEHIILITLTCIVPIIGLIIKANWYTRYIYGCYLFLTIPIITGWFYLLNAFTTSPYETLFQFGYILAILLLTIALSKTGGLNDNSKFKGKTVAWTIFITISLLIIAMGLDTQHNNSKQNLNTETNYIKFDN